MRLLTPATIYDENVDDVTKAGQGRS